MSEQSIRRRARKRRESLSSSSRAEGLSIGDYEDDDELEQFDLSERLRSLKASGEDDGDFTPRMRLKELEDAKDPEYTKEYKLELLHRLLLRKVPTHKIAEELKVHIITVYKYKRELKERLKEGAKKLNINELIGETVGFYDEIGAMALRAASLDKIPMNYRIAAMRTALGSKNDLHRFLNNAGVYDVLKFSPNEDHGVSDIEKLVQATEQLLGGVIDDTKEDDEEHVDVRDV